MTRSLLFATLLMASPSALAGKKDKAQPAATPTAPPPTLSAPAAAPPPAATGPGQAAYDYRKEVFQGLGKHMKALSFFAKGTLDPRTPDLVGHATAIHEMSKLVPGLFPDGSGPDAVPGTEALASIWTDPAGFAASSQALQTESAALVEIAAGGDINAFKAQLGKVGGTCGACHDGYRKDDD